MFSRPAAVAACLDVLTLRHLRRPRRETRLQLSTRRRRPDRLDPLLPLPCSSSLSCLCCCLFPAKMSISLATGEGDYSCDTPQMKLHFFSHGRPILGRRNRQAAQADRVYSPPLSPGLPPSWEPYISATKKARRRKRKIEQKALESDALCVRDTIQTTKWPSRVDWTEAPLVHRGNVKIWNPLPVDYRVHCAILPLVSAWPTCLHLHRQASAGPRARLKDLVFGTPKRQAHRPSRRVPCASESAT